MSCTSALCNWRDVSFIQRFLTTDVRRCWRKNAGSSRSGMCICKISCCCPTAELAKWHMNGYSSSSIDAGESFHVSCQNSISWQTDASLIPNDITTLYPVAGSKVTWLSLVHPLNNHQLCWFGYERLRTLSAVLLDRDHTSKRVEQNEQERNKTNIDSDSRVYSKLRIKLKENGGVGGGCGLPL